LSTNFAFNLCIHMRPGNYLLLFVFSILSFPALSQDLQQEKQFKPLLDAYLRISEGLVQGKPVAASASAIKFAEAVNLIDYKFISEGNINALLKDATIISSEQDIKMQRQAFAALSENMIALVESLNYKSSSLYKIYCPMKKVNWLSDIKEIKNPYYGKAMLTCGELIKTY
jgi:hypothetical protein